MPFNATIETEGQMVIFKAKLKQRLSYYEIEPLKNKLKEQNYAIYYDYSARQRAGTPATTPLLSLEFDRKVTHSHTWQVNDAEVRGRFIQFLKALETELITLGALDSKDLDLDRLLRDMQKKRSREPLAQPIDAMQMAIGNKTYIVSFKEAPTATKFILEDQFKTAVAEIMANDRLAYERKLMEELEKFKADFKTCLPLTEEDFRQGYGTFCSKGVAFLTLDFIYQPKGFIDSAAHTGSKSMIYPFKDPKLVAATAAKLVYNTYNGDADILRNDNKKRLITPHSYTYNALCYGKMMHEEKPTITNMTALKTFVRRIADQLEYINLGSLGRSYMYTYKSTINDGYGEKIDLTDRNAALKIYCKSPNKITELVVDGEDEIEVTI